MELRGFRLRLLALKLVLAAAAVVAIFLSYGALQGIEPGVSLIVVLMSMKILEAHTAREFHFMVMLGWVLCLCGFFLAQDFATAICVMVAFTLLATALIQFYRGSAAGVIWPPLRSVLILFLQALPLIALLFLLFPRVTAGFRLLLGPSGMATSGFSDRISPGSIEAFANSSAVAFRAEFPEGKLPPGALYWRGLVLTQGDGMEWRSRDTPLSISRFSQQLPAGGAVRQWITIEPHGANWMFALDRPINAPSGAILTPANYLWSWQRITKPRRYEVASNPEIAQKDLQPRERERLLDVPTSISPAVRALAASWVAADPDPREIVKRAIDFFRTQRFRYSLSPGAYKKNDLDEFLFRRRIGFCEHYAASFATLMRLAGVPARVVVGYLGGEFNEIGRFYLVRQSDTHAWCEVWLPAAGWKRVDPTSVVAPERVNLGFDSFLERRGEIAEMSRRAAFTRTFARQPVFAKIRVVWQTLNYAWDSRVLGFDAETQQTFAKQIGLPVLRPISLLLLSAGISIVFIVTIAGLMQLRARTRSEPVQRLYGRFCAKAARIGVTRHPCEGPVDFSRRLIEVLPEESTRVVTISKCYVALRYGSEINPGIWNKFAHEVQLFISRRK